MDGTTYEFIYDGFSRRIMEKVNGTPSRTWVWSGLEIVEERAGNGSTVLKRFYPQGEEWGTGTEAKDYYYTFDHLGSIQEMTDSNRNIVARYAYSPWGETTKIQGTLDASFTYTGHFMHHPTGLVLAPYRAYDPSLGRWLSRDPIAENGGINLYAYVSNNPVFFIDPFGLDNLSFHNPWLDEEERNLAKMAAARGKSKWEYTVSGHGTPEHLISKLAPKSSPLQIITPEQLAKMILSDPDYKPGMPVRLYACSIGGDASPFKNYAQRLANLLKAPVWAPTEDVWMRGFIFGDLVISFPPYIEKGGFWKVFDPE